MCVRILILKICILLFAAKVPCEVGRLEFFPVSASIYAAIPASLVLGKIKLPVKIGCTSLFFPSKSISFKFFLRILIAGNLMCLNREKLL